jgi:LmbE family N-acetylglucosaminyl deacetylase
MRKFRPDIVVTRFPSEDTDTHGHHTASARLAAEAFRAAGDAQRFPEQLKFVRPWQPKRLLWNSWAAFRAEMRHEALER